MSTFPSASWNFQRRAILLSIILLSFVMVACGSSTSTNGPVTLTFWTWVSGIQTEVNLFEKTHPNIHIKVVNAGQGAAQYTKLNTALKAGSSAPDIVQIEFPYLPEFASSGKLVDLSQYGATSAKSDFVPWTWNQVSQGTKVFAIPQDSGPMGLLYRQDILAKYHLPVPQTWTQFAQEAVTLHQANPKAYLTEFSVNDPNWFFSLLWQAGSHPFTVNGTNLSIHLDDAAALKVADYWGNLINMKAIPAAPDFTNDWYTGLANGTYASWPTAAWGPGFLTGVAKSSSGSWRAAEMPQWTPGGHVSANWGGSTDAVTTQSAHPKEATEFAIWLNTNAQSTVDFTQISSQLLFPTTIDTLQNPAVTNATPAFFGGQQVNKLYAQLSQQVDPNFQWSPFTDYVYNQWIDSYGKAINGSMSYEQAMHELQKNVVAYATAQGFTVS